MAKANPPPGIRKIPKALFNDPETRAFFQHIIQILFQLWDRTGGGSDTVSETVIRESFAWMLEVQEEFVNADLFDTQIAEENVFVDYSEPETTVINYSVDPLPFEWMEATPIGSYQASNGEWLKASHGPITFPLSPGADDRLRITKNTRSVQFNGNGKKLRWRGRTYDNGYLPGGTGSVLDLAFFVDSDEWQIV